MSGIDGKKLQVALLAGVVTFLTVASVAWACTFQPRFVALSEQAGPRGSTVTVTGEGAVPGSAVELRWDGVKGLPLASATADELGSFAAQATIPDVAPDVYSLMIVTEEGVSRTAFEVTTEGSLAAPAANPLPANAWSGLVNEPTGFASPTPTALPTGASDTFGLGTALLAVGMVALASGTGVVAARRRRATVSGRP